MDEAAALSKFLDDFFDDRIGSIHTMQPCTVVSFDASALTMRCTLDKEGIELSDVPVTLFGNPDNYITAPIEAGSTGLLIFSKHDLYTWVTEGSDPEAKNDFSKNNAFFLIGATNAKSTITYNQDAIEIKSLKKAIEIFASKTASVKSDQLVELNAPKISLTNTASGEELFDLLVQTATALKDVATELSTTLDSTGGPISSGTNFATMLPDLATLITKLEGFKNV